MKKKKIIFEAIFLVFITGLTIYYLITSGIFQHITELKDVSAIGICILLLVVLFYISCDAFIIMRNIQGVGKKASLLDGLGAYSYGNLGSSITPWKSAHFPMFAYFLRKRHLSTEETLSVMASNQMIYSITLPVLYFMFMIYSIVNHYQIPLGNIQFPLFLACLIGILTNITYFVVLMLMLYNEKVQIRIMNLEIKLKRMKDEEKIKAYKEEKLLKMKIYRITADRMRKNIVYNLPSILAYVVFMLVSFGFPYIIYLVISKGSFDIKEYLYCFILCQAMSYVTNIIPVPGGMLAAEFSFITVFEGFMGSYVELAVLLYRFFTFLLLIIVDFIFIVIFELVTSMKKE